MALTLQGKTKTKEGSSALQLRISQCVTSRTSHEPIVNLVCLLANCRKKKTVLSDRCSWQRISQQLQKSCQSNHSNCCLLLVIVKNRSLIRLLVIFQVTGGHLLADCSQQSTNKRGARLLNNFYPFMCTYQC